MSNNNIDLSNLFKYSTHVKQETKSEKNDTELLNDEKISNDNEQKFEEISPEKVYDYLTLSGNYNKQASNIKMNKISAVKIDPAKYLSADRIRDIEASMMRFDELYEKAYTIIDDEIGNTISEAAKQSLAALYLM